MPRNVARTPRKINFDVTVPAAAMASHVSHGARVLLALLVRWGESHRSITPSVARLAEGLGCSERTARRYLAELAAAGLVWRLYRGGRGKRCVLFLRPPGQRWDEFRRFEGAPRGARRGVAVAVPGTANPDTDGRQTTPPLFLISESTDREIEGTPASADATHAPVAAAVLAAAPVPAPIGAEPRPPSPSPREGESDATDTTDAAAPAPPAQRSRARRAAKGAEVAAELWRLAWALWRSAYRREHGRAYSAAAWDPSVMAWLVRQEIGHLARRSPRWSGEDLSHRLRWVFKHTARLGAVHRIAAARPDVPPVPPRLRDLGTQGRGRFVPRDEPGPSSLPPIAMGARGVLAALGVPGGHL